MNPTRLRHVLLHGYAYGVAVVLFLPLGVVALLSFKDASFVGFPVGRLTTGWYAVLAADRDMLDALGFSAAVAVLSGAAALAIGTWCAMAIDELPPGPARLLLLGGTLVPLVTPGIIAAISLRMFLRVLGLEPGLASVTFGHTVQAVPYVTLVVGARLRTLPPELIEAARDLGATETQAFASVTVPYLRPALLGAFVLALLLSFDDFVRAFFLSGYRVTLPVLIYGRLNGGLSPEINAAATLLLLLTTGFGLFGQRLFGRAATPLGRPADAEPRGRGPAPAPVAAQNAEHLRQPRSAAPHPGVGVPPHPSCPSA